MNKSKTHLIEDPSLGGLKREYVEVERKADVGDIKILPDGTVLKAVEAYDRGECRTRGMYFEDKNGERYPYLNEGYYPILKSTGIVVYGGARYKLADRKAEVGEKVVSLIDDKCHGEREFCVGSIHEVTDVEIDDDGDIQVGISEDRAFYYEGKEYLVLVPVDKASLYLDDKKVAEIPLKEELIEVTADQASPAVIDMLGNLAQRIVDLERSNKRLEDEIDTLHKNQKRLGEELANQAHKTPFDADEVIVELAKLLVESHRREAK